MKIVKIIAIVLMTIVLFISISFYKYYTEPINENDNIQLNIISMDAYIKRMENKHDIKAFHKLLNITLPTDPKYWYILNIAAKYNIDPKLTARKLFFLGHNYIFTNEQEKFLIGYISNNKVLNFDNIYCDYYNLNDKNYIFLNSLKKIFMNKNPNFNFKCNQYKKGEVFDIEI